MTSRRGPVSAALEAAELGRDGSVRMMRHGASGDIVACVDAADPHQDFALFVRSGVRNFPGLNVVALIRQTCPLPMLDEDRLAFYRTLDEFS
jgi:aminoglycoside phosphotransferase